MRWAFWYRLSDRTQASMWMLPALYVVAALVLGVVFPAWDRSDPSHLLLDLQVDSVRSALGAISSGMITFTGLVFSIVMLVVQFGSSAFSTRLMRWFWRDWTVKHALGTFIATFLFSLVALASVASVDDSWVPTRTFTFALVLLVLSVAMFLVLLARISATLRVARISRQLGIQTVAALDEIYRPAAAVPSEQPERQRSPLEGRVPDLEVRQVGHGASIVALDRAGLLRFARRHDVALELVPAVGDHVSRGAVLFRVYGTSPIDERRLRRGLVLGEERTLDGDPSFGFRLLVDVGLKALSPAVNDPTTAVQVLDRLDDLLRHACQLQLDIGIERDEAGDVRVVYPTPSWDDLITLALDELRLYGARSPQVTRRIEALLDDLHGVATPARRAAINRQRQLLAATIAGSVDGPSDRRFAAVPDQQGIGPTRPPSEGD
jgi:uncharacterized membrane protein